MAVSSKTRSIGDIILSEAPRHYCRSDHEVTRDLAATVGLVAGQAMDFTAAAVAAVQTYTTAGGFVADGGSYRIGWMGFWTTALAWDANIVAINAALDVMVVLSGNTAGDIVCANVGGDLLISTNTFTFLNTEGNVEDIVLDLRLMTDGGLTYAAIQAATLGAGGFIATTTAGELTTGKEWATTTANIDSILLEPVSLTDLQNGDGETLKRSFLTRGPATVNADAITCPAGTVAAAVAALLALTPSIIGQREATMTNAGTPRV